MFVPQTRLPVSFPPPPSPPSPHPIMPKALKKAKAALTSMKIPKPDLSRSNGSSPVTPKTPKTPADEGLEFFESVGKGDQPIHVYELRLDPDGGPNKDRAVSISISTSGEKRRVGSMEMRHHFPQILSSRAKLIDLHSICASLRLTPLTLYA